MTTSETPPSQPESLDLDYDLWQGQFEFVGPSYNNSIDFTKSKRLEDLYINQGVPKYQPILNDESRQLSLHADSDSSSSENMHLNYLSENKMYKCPINIGYTTELRENHSGKVCLFYI